jgi:hypothetical protein
MHVVIQIQKAKDPTVGPIEIEADLTFGEQDKIRALLSDHFDAGHIQDYGIDVVGPLESYNRTLKRISEITSR